MDICCLNFGSKVLLKLGPACNTLTETCNLLLLHRGFLVLCADEHTARLFEPYQFSNIEIAIINFSLLLPN